MEKEISHRALICSQCGAPLPNAYHCEYCGSYFEGWAQAEARRLKAIFDMVEFASISVKDVRESLGIDTFGSDILKQF